MCSLLFDTNLISVGQVEEELQTEIHLYCFILTYVVVLSKLFFPLDLSYCLKCLFVSAWGLPLVFLVGQSCKQQIPQLSTVVMISVYNVFQRSGEEESRYMFMSFVTLTFFFFFFNYFKFSSFVPVNLRYHPVSLAYSRTHYFLTSKTPYSKCPSSKLLSGVTCLF